MIQEELMKRINVLLSRSVISFKVQNLWYLTFLLFNFSLTNSNFHIWLCKTLHWWCRSTRISASCGLTGSSICCSAFSLSWLCLKLTNNQLHQISHSFFSNDIIIHGINGKILEKINFGTLRYVTIIYCTIREKHVIDNE